MRELKVKETASIFSLLSQPLKKAFNWEPTIYFLAFFSSVASASVARTHFTATFIVQEDELNNNFGPILQL